MAELQPLLKNQGRSESFYFLQGRRESNAAINREGEAEGRGINRAPSITRTNRDASLSSSRGQGFFVGLAKWLGLSSSKSNSGSGTKLRKVPIKVEPKVFFANERTFLAWLHMAITLAGVAVAITAFAETNKWSVYYGLALMPVAIAFCVYALWLYTKRAQMIRRKDPGPYEDRMGPTILATLLAVSMLVNFAMKIFELNT